MVRSINLLMLTLLFALGGQGVVLAEPIRLDSTFGTAGATEVIMPNLPSADVITRTHSQAQSADGRLILLAQSSSSLVLVRLMPGGTVDMGFGNQGQVVFAEDMTGVDLLVQSDGKILVLAKGSNATVRRLLSDGTLDVSFSGDGIYELPTTGTPSGVVSPRRLCLQADGKILVAAETQPSYSADWMILRLLADGTPDTTWGTAGEVNRDVQASKVDLIGGMALQSDGRVVVCGTVQNSAGTSGDVAVVRFLAASGAVDTSFGTSGSLVYSLGTREEQVYDMTVQSDDKIVLLAASYIIPPSRYQTSLLRLTAAGALDSSFDGDGRVNLTLGAYSDNMVAVEQDASGRLVVAGSQQDTFQSRNRTVVTRLTTNGALDTTFDGDGMAVLAPTQNLVYGAGLALQADGDWIITGQQLFPTGNSLTDVAAARINPDGSLDTDYGVAGIASKDLQIDAQLAQAQNVALQTDGRLVLAGKAQDAGSSTTWLGVSRLLPNGMIDASYGSNGVLSLSGVNPATALTVQPDGAALIGASIPYVYDVALVRLNQQGFLDSSFGNDGIASFNLGTFGERVSRLQVLPGGQILAAGYADQSFFLMRLLGNGARDTSFGTNGVALTTIGNSSSEAHAMVVQTDGKVVLAGQTTLDNGDVAIALARYDVNGTLDPTFSGDGIQKTQAAGAYRTEANDLLVLADGTILVVGTTYQGSSQVDAIVLRYLQDGTLDNTFGNAGLVRIDTQFGSERALCAAKLANGRIAVSGILQTSSQNFWFLALLDATGALAAPLSVMAGPVQPSAVWQQVSGATGMVTDPDGNIVVAGGNERNMVAMKYLAESGKLFHSYAAWMADRFTPVEQLDVLLSGPAADFDGDGVVNAIEYVLDTPPKSATAPAPINLSTITHSAGHYVEISFTYPASLPKNATLVMESSPGLDHSAVWTPLATRMDSQYWSSGNVSEELLHDGRRRATGMFNYPLSVPRVFFRLKVDAP